MNTVIDSDKQKTIVRNYLNKYYPDLKEDLLNNERKKAANAIKKLCDPNTVFNIIPFAHLTVDTQVNILHFIKDEIPDRQIFSNIEKIDVDKDYSKIEIHDKEVDDFTERFLKIEMPDYTPINLSLDLRFNRDMIRHPMNSPIDTLHELIDINDNVLFAYEEEYELFRCIGIHIENIDYIKDYIRYSIDDILQFLNYKILNNINSNTAQILNEMNKEVQSLSIKIDNEIQTNTDYNLSASQITKYFCGFINHRNKLLEEIIISDVLHKEIVDNPLVFRMISTEDKAPKIILPDNEISKHTNIITDGNHYDKYDEKLEIVRKFINIMREYGGKQCWDTCPQDLKVFFREIYASKIVFRRKQTRKIVEDYIKKYDNAISNKIPVPIFDKESQYMFVREKINRGYFIETGHLTEYISKINVTQSFYKMILKAYGLYDTQTSIKFIHFVNDTLLRKYLSLLS